MSDTPRTDAATVTTDFITGAPVVPSDFARQLETELNEAIRRKDAISKRAEAMCCELVETSKQLVESQAREAQLREAIELNTGWDLQFDKNGKELPMIKPKWVRDALSQPAPPVVPLADLEAFRECPHGCTDGNCPHDRKYRELKAKHPDL